MATQRPVNPVVPGITARELDEDERQFKELESLLPQNLEKLISEYFTQGPSEGLACGLGDPSAIIGEIAEIAKMEGVEIEAEKLSQDVTRLIRRIASRSPDADTIKDETAIAQYQLVRHFVDQLYEVTEMWRNPPSGVVLNKSELRPVTECPSGREEWSKCLEDSANSLRSSVALSADHLAHVTGHFCEEIWKRLAAGAYHLPLRLKLSAQGDQVLLTRSDVGDYKHQEPMAKTAPAPVSKNASGKGPNRQFRRLLLVGFPLLAAGALFLFFNHALRQPSLERSVPSIEVRTTGKTIKIVSSLPRTGITKYQTDTIVNGIKMAIEEEGSKVGQFNIEYQDLDSASQQSHEKEASNAQLAVADGDVMIYIGTYSSDTAKVSMPLLNQAGMLMISPANTLPGLTKRSACGPESPEQFRPTNKINFVRVVPADDLQGPLGAKWAKEMRFERVFVIDDSESYGKGIATLFKDECNRSGLKILGHESINPKAPKFEGVLSRIVTSKPDLIYFGGTTETMGGQLARVITSSDIKCKLMVPDGCYEQAFINVAGAQNLNDRCFVTFGGIPPDKLQGNGKAFIEKYRAKFSADPEPYALYGYESAKVALESIRRAGVKNRDAIREACLSINSVQQGFDRGALGKWWFDEAGDTSHNVISGMIVRNGRFEFVRLLGQPD